MYFIKAAPAVLVCVRVERHLFRLALVFLTFFFCHYRYGTSSTIYYSALSCDAPKLSGDGERVVILATFQIVLIVRIAHREVLLFLLFDAFSEGKNNSVDVQLLRRWLCNTRVLRMLPYSKPVCRICRLLVLCLLPHGGGVPFVLCLRRVWI